MSTGTAQQGATAMTAPSGFVQWLKQIATVNPRVTANIAALIVIAMFLQYQTGVFFSVRNLQAISMAIAVVTILSYSQTLALIAGQIDVSILGVISFASVVGALTAREGYSFEMSILMSMLAGLSIGIVNAFLIVVLRITAFIATIGTLYVSYGMASLITNGIPVTQVPEGFSTMGNGFIGQIPVVVPIILGVFLLFLFVEKATVLGRYIVAVGSNREAAFDNGINVNRIVLIIYMVSGTTAGFAGLLYASRISSATPALDTNVLFQVIVACVIGGAGMTGGQGSIFGTFIGSILIGVIYNGLNLLGVATWWQPIALGLVLVITVTFGGDVRQRVAEKIRAMRKGRKSHEKLKGGGTQDETT